MKPLTKQFIRDYKQQFRSFNKSTSKFTDYFCAVVNQVFYCFEYRIPDSIWFPGAEECTTGIPNLSEKNIPYQWYYVTEPYKMIDLCTKNYDYDQSIPLKFLTMSLSEIKKYLEKEIEAYNKEKVDSIKDAKQLVKNAKDKLTQDEIEALKLYGLKFD